jgi:4-hydroxy-4-methyl-2-oxoglutarate aldolase
MEHLLKLGSSTLCEASGLDNISFGTKLRPVWPGAAMAGPAWPVRCAPGDNLAIHHGLATAPKGSVLVVDGAGVETGYWGEVLTVQAQAAGLAGLVINGCVRDIDAMQARGFPVFARGISMIETVKACAPSCGTPMQMLGVDVAVGDMVVADTDGVLVLPAAELERTIKAGIEREQKEALFMEQLAKGATTLELFGLG